jgi:hypothetical protein
VNLGFGVLAIVPLYLVWWLLTEYLPMDCHSVEDATKAGLTNCNYTTLDHAGPVMFILAVICVGILPLMITVDVVLPRRRGRLGAWLGSAVLIPVPFVICLVLG